METLWRVHQLETRLKVWCTCKQHESLPKSKANQGSGHPKSTANLHASLTPSHTYAVSNTFASHDMTSHASPTPAIVPCLGPSTGCACSCCSYCRRCDPVVGTAGHQQHDWILPHRKLSVATSCLQYLMRNCPVATVLKGPWTRICVT